MFGAGSSAGKIEVSITAKYDGSDFKRLDSDLNKAERSTSALTTDMNRLDRATDKASRTSGRMGTAAAGLGASMKGALKGGAVVAAAAIGTGLVVALQKSIEEARESERVNRQTAAVIKSTGGAANLTADQISRLSTSLSNKTAIDDEAVQSGANLLLTFKNIRNETGKGNDIFNQATSSILDLSAGMDQSLKTSALQVGKALNDPTKGMTALTRAGVTFTDQQKAQIEAMQKSGNMMGAQKLILRELESQFKGSAEAQADPIKRLTNIFNNLLEKVGGALLPTLNKAATSIGDFFLEMQQGKGTGGDVADFISELAQAFAATAPVFKVIFQVLGWLIARFNDLPGPIKAILVPFLRAPYIIKAVVAAFNFFKGIVSTVAKAVGGFVSGLWGKVKNAFGNIRDFVVNAAKKGFLGPIPWIISNWNGLMSFVRSIPGKVKSGLARVAGIITAPFRSAVNIVKGVIGSIPGILSSGISAAKGVINGVIGGVNKLIGAFNKLPGGDIGPITPLAEGGRVSRAQLFIAGEGNKPEWVISQEGDRKRNQGYVMEAARALGIPMFANGGRVQDGEIQLAKAELTATLQDDLAAARNLEKVYGDSVSFFEGSKSPIKSLGQQKTNLQKALSKAKGAENKKKIKKQLKAVSEKLDSKKSEYLSDLGSLKQYRDMVTDLTAEITGGGDTAGGGSSASEQLVAFNEERLSLLSSFGGNFARRAGPMAPSSSSTTQGSTSSSKTSVTVNQTYTEPPKDAHSWTRNIQNEIAALI